MSISIDFDQKAGRFVIKSPYWAIGIMRAIPNRRWEKKLEAWTCPALRANINYLKQALPTQAEFSPAARAKFHDVENNTGVPQSRQFPTGIYEFKTEPYAHQMMALHHMYGMNAFALFMDMRTGKTKVVIDCAIALWAEGLLDRVVIIPSFTLRRNWQRDFSKHAFDSAYEMHHLDTTRIKKFDQFNQDENPCLKVLMVGVESLSAGRAADLTLSFLRGSKCMVVIDESDTIKNHSAIRTKKVFELRDKAEYRIIMTGTPTDKGPMDLFAQFEFLDPNIIGIGDYYSFRNRYAIMGGYDDKEIVGYQNMQEMLELIKPYVYQVRYTEVFSSPAKIPMLRTVQMTDEQKKIYKRIKKDGTIRIEGEKIELVVQNVLERMLRMQEVAGGHWAEAVKVEGEEKPTYKHHKIPGRNPKLDELVKMLLEPEFAEEQGIIWAIHREEIKDIAYELAGHGVIAEFHGGVSEEDRAEIDEGFRAGRIKWIIANPTTGGRGYTFDAAGFMVNYSSNFRFITRQQSLERATAAHKTKPVVVVDLICEDTVDEVILESHENKLDVAEYVRNAIAGRKRGVDELLVGG